VKAWKGLDGFRGECKLSSWLFRIARNESYTFINRSKKIAGIPLDDLEERLPGHLSNDALYSGDEIAQKLDAAIATLPEKQKEVFILKYYQDLPYEEISEITGTSVGGLKANYHHAVNKIKAILELD
jgi:RNA polymerase sigma-70 factor (ECF subfamily)